MSILHADEDHHIPTTPAKPPENDENQIKDNPRPCYKQGDVLDVSEINSMNLSSSAAQNIPNADRLPENPLSQAVSTKSNSSEIRERANSPPMDPLDQNSTSDDTWSLKTSSKYRSLQPEKKTLSPTLPKASRKRLPEFPRRLYSMLEDAERDGFDHLISWMPDGKAFKVHFERHLRPCKGETSKDEREFVELLKNYFNQTKLRSFRRQLQNYGFENILKGPHKGICRHRLLVRGNLELMFHKTIDDFRRSGNSCPPHVFEIEVATRYPKPIQQKPKKLSYMNRIHDALPKAEILNRKGKLLEIKHSAIHERPATPIVRLQAAISYSQADHHPPARSSNRLLWEKEIANLQPILVKSLLMDVEELTGKEFPSLAEANASTSTIDATRGARELGEFLRKQIATICRVGTSYTSLDDKLRRTKHAKDTIDQIWRLLHTYQVINAVTAEEE